MFNRLILILGSVLVSACGSSSGDESNPDLLPQNNSPNVPRYEVPQTINGFYLTSETVTFENGDVLRQIDYELDSANKTLSQFSIDSNGDRVLDIVFSFDDDGQIVSEEVFIENGEISQTSNHVYDSQRRLVSTDTLLSEEPFLTTNYFFNDVGAPFQNVVKATNDNIDFSTTTYQYDSDRRLTSSILNTPLLPADIRKLYTFSADGTQLLSVDEQIDGGASYEYDSNGNVVREITRNGDEIITGISEFSYERTNMIVPNVILHQLAYEFDRLF